MKRLVSITLFLFCSGLCYGQKPALSIDSYQSWSSAINGDLSEDGNYAFYTKHNIPLGQSTFCLTNTKGKLLFSKIGLEGAKFSKDSKFMLGLIPGDSLLIYELKTGAIRYVPGIASFHFGDWAGSERIIAKDVNERVHVMDHKGKDLYVSAPVQELLQSSGGAVMVLVEPVDSKQVLVKWISAANGQAKMIYNGKAPHSFKFDGTGKKLAFWDDSDGNPSLMYYRAGDATAVLLYKNDSLDLQPGEFWDFSKDGTRLFIAVMEKGFERRKPLKVDPQISSYQDNYLQTYYFGKSIFGENISSPKYLASIDVVSHQLLKLTKNDETIVNDTYNPALNDYCVVEQISDVRSNSWVNRRGRSYQLCNLKTGERLPLQLNVTLPIHYWNVSPQGKYVAYYKVADTTYHCYDIANSQDRNVTAGFGYRLIRYDKFNYPHPNFYPGGIMGWVNDEKSLIVRGTYDLWAVDPLSKEKPNNLTGGLGERDRIIFSLAYQKMGSDLGDGKDLVISAFDMKNKNFGFYRVGVNGNLPLQKLSMAGRFLADVYASLPKSVISKRAGGYLLNWEAADRAGNYYFSRDLKSFTPLSDVASEKPFNWLTSELHTYKDSQGNELQGILYKPENFDPAKKYPIIFTIYEVQSNNLNRYYVPNLAGSSFMLPWMVSNGYLVFAPDIKCDPRFGGDAAVRCLNAALDHMSAFKWVDTTNMGLSGHSVGGFLTNYAVTHMKRFKAALSGAGISDMIRASTDLWEDGKAKQDFLRDAVYMMDVDLLDDTEAYIRNSPILNAKHLETPLLLMHNDRDESVRFEQTRAFFMVLRNLQKPVWWLRYDGQGHQVTGKKNQKDYSTKVKQFFDHYLKAEPLPDWMTEHN